MMRWPFARRRPAMAARMNPQEAYALWAASYPPRPHNRLMELEQATVLSLLPVAAGLVALDAGCGTGRYLRELERRGARAFGVDLSREMLARAGGARLARANLCALPIAALSVDLIVCGLALGDLPHPEIALVEMARVLRPGGTLVYSVVHPWGSAAGWTRTFEAGGRQCAIDGYWHSLEEHRQACAVAGLAVSGWEEPVLDEAPAHPAVLVVRACR